MVPLPANNDPEALADWLELEILLSGRPVARDYFVALAADEPSYVSPAKTQGSLEAQLEELAESAMAQITVRSASASDGYPLTRENELIRLKDDPGEAEWYLFLALLNARKAYGLPVAVARSARLFEEFVTCVLAGYLNGLARRVGWPVDAGDPDFEARTRRLAADLGEIWGGLDAVSPYVKDHALDVIGWKPFYDSRQGQLVLLCQCAIGDDWDRKAVKVEVWQDVIRFATRPVPTLAFPWIQPSNATARAHWRGLCLSGGLLFDRIRLIRYSSKCSTNEELRDAITRWNRDAASMLSVATS